MRPRYLLAPRRSEAGRTHPETLRRWTAARPGEWYPGRPRTPTCSRRCRRRNAVVPPPRAGRAVAPDDLPWRYARHNVLLRSWRRARHRPRRSPGGRAMPAYHVARRRRRTSPDRHAGCWLSRSRTDVRTGVRQPDRVDLPNRRLIRRITGQSLVAPGRYLTYG
ncbi:Uncharacterised protein [Mycobacteroides abscessus subsp. massiliense]|nr:Uncharacterised protein [Mycobacteroides abscessus subsp. massiliense]